MWHTPAEDSPAIPGPARQDRSARSCHGPLTGPIPAKRAPRGRRGQLVRARLRDGPSRQRSASKPRDRARSAGYPAGTCHRPPVDLRRQRSQASPNDPPPGQRLRRCPRPPSSTPAPPQARPFARHHPAARRRSTGVRPGFRRCSSARSMSRNRWWGGTSPRAGPAAPAAGPTGPHPPGSWPARSARAAPRKRPHMRSSTAVRVRNTRRRRPSSQPGAALLEVRAAEIAIIDPVMVGWPNSEASSRSKDSLRHAFRCNADDHERHCPAVRPRCR